MSEVGKRIWQNRLDAKIADYENAVKEHGEASEEAIYALEEVAKWLKNDTYGDAVRAAKTWERAVELRLSRTPEGDEATADAMSEYAQLLDTALKDPQSAITYGERAYRMHRRFRGETSVEVISALRNLAFYLLEAGEYTRAAALAEEACASFLAATLGDESEMSILCRRLASAAYARSETPEKALPHLEATLAYTLARNGEDDPSIPRLREKIAEIKG